jgi:predicted RNA binding protein YcfA (HicA-like mRNA interferase family)
MAYSASVWSQLKNITADELISALEKSGWKLEPGCKGAIQVYRNAKGERAGVHYHPKKTYGPKLLKGLLEDIGWTEDELKRLKLIK